MAAANTASVALVTAGQAVAGGDVQSAALALLARLTVDRSLFMTSAGPDVCRLVWLSEDSGQPIEGLTARDLQPPLEQAAEQNDAKAFFTLGRALCGIRCGPNDATIIVARRDVRRGVALLVRAAEGGFAQAWLHLYFVSSQGPASVNNPMMAQFCRGMAIAAGLLAPEGEPIESS